MKPKPSRTFVYLALIMVFLLVLGLVVVGMLISSNRAYSPFDLTADCLCVFNPTVAVYAIQTETAKAESTPFYYTADMSPTVALYELCPFFHPTPPYDPELYERRCKEMFGLITGGGPTEYARFYITETALVAEYQTMQSLTATPTPSLTLTVSPIALATSTTESASFTQCAYSWAHRDLPDVTTLAQAALDKIDIPKTTVRADAYGEDCIDLDTNKVKSFGAMTTDFYLTVELSNLGDQTALADYVSNVYTALIALPQDSLPARPGYLDMTFTSTAETKHLRTTFDEIKSALDKGLTGANFLDALDGLR
jgi:hypothetical protein